MPNKFFAPIAVSFVSLAGSAAFAQTPVAASPLMAISTDAVHYADVTADNDIEIRDRTQAAALPPLETIPGPKAQLTALAYSMDGAYIAAADADRQLIVWDAQTGKRLCILLEPKQPKGADGTTQPESRILAVAFGPGNTDLVAVDAGFHWLVDYTGSDPAHFAYKNAVFTAAPLTSIASDSHGGWIVGDQNGAIHFYDSLLKESSFTQSKVAGAIRTIAVSDDGRRIATGGDDSEVMLWQYDGAVTSSDGLTFLDRLASSGPLQSLVFRAHWKTMLFTDNVSHQFNEWDYVNPLAKRDLASIAPRHTELHVAPVAPPVPSVPSIAMVNRDIRRTSATPILPVTTISTSVSSLSLPPEASQALRPLVTAFRTLTGHTGYVNDLAFSLDGRTLASASRDKTIRLWNVEKDAPSRVLAHESAYASAVTFSPNGQILATGGWDDRIRLFGMADNGQERGDDSRFDKQKSYVLSLDFSPDGKLLASGSNDKTIRLFQVATGASRATPPLPDGVASVNFSPDGHRVVGACLDGSVYVWDVQSLALVHKLTPAQPRPVYCTAFIDNDTIVSGGKGGLLRVWRISTGKQISSFLAGSDVYSLAYSPQKQLLAGGSVDKLIRIWSGSEIEQPGNSARPLVALPGHASTVRSLAFSPDGDTLASGGWDDNIVLWHVTDANSASSALR